MSLVVPPCEHRVEQGNKTYCTHDRNISKLSREKGIASTVDPVVCSICTFHDLPIVQLALTVPRPIKHRVIAKGAGAAKLKGPTTGPGKELHGLLTQLGFSIGGCSCKSWIAKMNRWGVDGCRQNRQQIVDHLTSMKDAASLTEKLKAGALAVANGLPLTIGGLVDEAIERAIPS